jgi:hypothetical protein
MLCQVCYRDLTSVGYDEVSGAWLYECAECPGVDGPLTVEVRDTDQDGDGAASSGLMADLKVYSTLREALGRRPGRWLEFGVVEHLYAQADPEAYQTLVERYGHGAVEPGERTASWMLGRGLWVLKRQNEVLVKGMAHGTGRWDYLVPCNAWALPGVSGNSTVVTWEAYADQEGFSALSHPAIDWRDTPNAEPAVATGPAE